MNFKSSAFLLLFAALTLQAAEGYSLLGYKWTKSTYQYYINADNKDVDKTATISALKKGANSWTSWCRPVYKGESVTKLVKNDGQNTVFFRSREYGAIASTYIFSKGDEILGFDMVFWDNPWTFFGGSKGCVDGFYLQDVAAHEFGHVIGIGHSRVREATMFPKAGRCNVAIRTLADDDKNAARQEYGIEN